MHPTEHRGLRELFAMTRQLRNHWRALAERIDGHAPQEAQLLRAGAELAGALIAELTDVTAARDLYGRPMAQGVGARLAGPAQRAGRHTLEVNQALRFAVLDIVHVVTLLDYLARAAAQDDDAELQRFLTGWRSGCARRRTPYARPPSRSPTIPTAPCATARPASPAGSATGRRRRWAPPASGSTGARGAEGAATLSDRARRSFPPPSGRARSCACRRSP